MKVAVSRTVQLGVERTILERDIARSKAAQKYRATRSMTMRAVFARPLSTLCEIKVDVAINRMVQRKAYARRGEPALSNRRIASSRV